MKRLFFPLFAGLLWLMSGTLSATERTYNVLFIQSYTKNTPWYSLLTENLENGLDKVGVKANITTEYLNADYWSFASECFIMRRICERARQRKTDLIVTSSDEAFFTLTHCGDSLPYQIPVVVSGIKYPDERVFERMPNVSGYVSKTDFDVLLDAAVRMFPSRRELVCLSDSSFLSLKGVKAVEESWERIKSNYPEHELKVLNVQAKSLNSIITSICYDYNAYKHIVIAPKWIPFLSLKLKAPVFTSQNLAMTNGVLCVYDAVPGEDAFAAGRQAASILKGKSPASLGSKGLWGQVTVRLQTVAVFPCGHEPCGEQGHRFEYTAGGALPCLVHSVLFADCRGIGAAGCLAFPCQPQGVAQAHTCPDPLVDTAPPGGAARRVRQYLLFHSRRLDYV